jgi:SAM-dependent methyltransferase
MRKVYELHEFEYRRMQEQGISSWEARNHAWVIDPQCKPFLADLLQQSWVLDGGRILEVGCGTGPLLRWFAARGFHGMGLDVSATAIQMARTQSTGSKLDYLVADICTLAVDRLGRFDLCIDGHALHCITDPDDRRQALARIRAVLRPNGVFVLMSMCAPVDTPNFARLYPRQRLIDSVIHVPSDDASSIIGTRRIAGKDYLPTRIVKHWRTLLTELRQAGFRPTLIRLNLCTTTVPDEPVSSLSVAALAG